MKRYKNRVRSFIILLFLLGAVSCVLLKQMRVEVPTIEGAQYAGSEKCIACHEDESKAFANNKHARIRPFEVEYRQTGCEACHGPGSVHVDKQGEKGTILSFKELSPLQRAEICLTCHTGEPVMDWRGSPHPSGDIACNDCHNHHRPQEVSLSSTTTLAKKATLKKDEPELCYGCHLRQRAQASYPSHHPIKEGKMKCSDCHQVHGSENENLREETINDLCYRCHPEKEGPFIYEHAPVEENCTYCHNSHGTIANNLLKQTEPFLCLRCHGGHRDEHHDMSTVAQRVAFYTRCSQCHAQIHGSDLPSVGVDRLTR